MSLLKHPFSTLAAVAAMTAVMPQAFAAPSAGAPPLPRGADSRITQVKVYPGSATIERSARVAAGGRSVTFSCLPAGLDPQSLQVSADATVHIGEMSVLMEKRSETGRCSGHPLDAGIRQIEDRKDALQAESDALDLVTSYLKKSYAGEPDAASPKLPVAAKQLVDTADALRRTAHETLRKRQQIERQQADLARELAPLLAERERSQGNEQVASVTVSVASASDADVKLSYQISGPTWSPSYRALLDTATRKVRIERQALVAQTTGEDWRGVKLLLSTGQPQRATSGRLPQAWQIGIRAPQPPMSAMPSPVAAAAPADRVRMVGKMDQRVPAVAGMPFDVSMLQHAHAVEFIVPQPLDVQSTGQRVAIALGHHDDTARLMARTSPSVEPAAYLLAELPLPPGMWPQGPMQLYRDGAFVGQGRWDLSTASTLTLSFGVDERVRVSVEPSRDNRSTTGFTGSVAERTLTRGYVVENRHDRAITVQVVEAAPVSVDERVVITQRFAPEPVDRAWNRQPGLTLWSLELAPGKLARVSADYVVSSPKSEPLQGL